MLAWFRPGSDRVNAPSWLGAALIGPVRRSAYSSAIAALPRQVAAISFSVPAARHLVDAPDLQVVLQVAADRRQIRHHLDPVLPEQRPRPQPRELQELRAVHRPRAQHHPSPRRHPAPVDELDPGAGEPLRPPLDAEPHHLRPGADREVPPPPRRPEEGADRVPPQPRPLVHLEVADPLVVAVVEVRARRNPRLLAGRGEGVEDRVVRPLPLDPELPRPAMQAARTPPRPRPPSASAPRARRNPAAPAPTTTPRPRGAPPSCRSRAPARACRSCR